MKLAEALLLRKQLAQKVEQLRPLKINGDQGVYQDQTQRIKISDDVEELRLKIARVDIKTVTREFDHAATSLRKLDALIQQANWAVDISFSETDAAPAPVAEGKGKKKA